MTLLPAALIAAESSDPSLAPSATDRKAPTGPAIEDAEPASVHDRMSRKISIDIQQVTVREAVSLLGMPGTVTIIVHPKFLTENSKVTLKLNDRPIRDGLRQIADQLGAQVYFLDSAYFISAEPPERKVSSEEVLTAEQRRALEEAIRELSADDFHVREAAQKKLFQMGTVIVAPIREILGRGISDAEQKQRLERLVWSVDISAEYPDTSVREILTHLTSISQWRQVLDVDEELKDRQITLVVRDMNFVHVRNWVARLAGGEFVGTPQGLKLVKRKQPGGVPAP